jgi:chromosome segregation ATPase
MNLPDKNTLLAQECMWSQQHGKTCDLCLEEKSHCWSRNVVDQYEAAIKPDIEELECELKRSKNKVTILLDSCDTLKMKNCDLELKIEHFERIKKKGNARISFVSDQLKGEQNENTQLKTKIAQLEAENNQLREAIKQVFVKIRGLNPTFNIIELMNIINEALEWK